MALPDFLCVGAQKSGTTSIHDILNAHPEVFVPREKELHFFDDNKNFTRGHEYYERFFKAVQNETAVGEITPSYMFLEDVPGRIRATLSDGVRLIFMLRNPADRAFSHYLMSRWQGYETETFLRALELEGDRLKVGGHVERLSFSYLERGFYSACIKRYLRHFSREQMHFVIFDDEFMQRREDTLRGLFEFLGVQSDVRISTDAHSHKTVLPRFGPLNRIMRNIRPFLSEILPKGLKHSVKSRLGHSPEKIDPDVREKVLKEHFMDDIHELEELLGRDLRIWYGSK